MTKPNVSCPNLFVCTNASCIIFFSVVILEVELNTSFEIDSDPESDGEQKTILLFSTNKEFETKEKSPSITSYSNLIIAQNVWKQKLMERFLKNKEWFVSKNPDGKDDSEWIPDVENLQEIEEEQGEEEEEEEDDYDVSEAEFSEIPKSWNKEQIALYNHFSDWVEENYPAHQPILYIYNVQRNELQGL